MVFASHSWSNPLILQRADPQISLVDGVYYFAATVPSYDRIELRAAATIAGLAEAPAVTIWRKHASGPMSWHIWAPELHRIAGKWYVYFAAGKAEAIWDIRMYVLECAGPSPLEGEWQEKGQIRTRWETFSLDATVFQHRGVRYLLWAQKDPEIEGNTNLYLAPLANPWTLGGEPVRLTRPEYAWETVGFLVNEGPAVLVRNGRIFVSYSASATDHHYCVGLLEIDENADLLDATQWRKSPVPVFASDDASGQYGPGHNSFTTTQDHGTDLLVYHARNYKAIEGDPLHNPDRHTRVQRLTWGEDGRPCFGRPVADGPYTI